MYSYIHRDDFKMDFFALVLFVPFFLVAFRAVNNKTERNAYTRRNKKRRDNICNAYMKMDRSAHH